jgi:hypothetical protein
LRNLREESRVDFLGGQFLLRIGIHVHIRYPYLYPYLYPYPYPYPGTQADEAVWDAASLNFTPTAPATNEIREAAGVIRLVENVRKSDLVLSSSGDLPGQYTWKFDQALPG